MSNNNFNQLLTKLLDEADVMAIKALDAGNANERQQKIALNAIANKLCRVGKISFSEESDRITAFNEGVRYVGLQIYSALKMDIAKYKASRTKN